jgi:hypothetical protein
LLIFGAFLPATFLFARHFSARTAARAKIRYFLRTFARRFWGDDTPTDRPTG